MRTSRIRDKIRVEDRAQALAGLEGRVEVVDELQAAGPDTSVVGRGRCLRRSAPGP